MNNIYDMNKGIEVGGRLTKLRRANIIFSKLNPMKESQPSSTLHLSRQKEGSCFQSTLR